MESQHSMDMTGSEGGEDGLLGGGKRFAVVARRWPHMKYKEFKTDRVRCGFRKVLSTSQGEKEWVGPNRGQEPPGGKEVRAAREG